MKIRQMLLTTTLCCAGLSAWATDTRFESSDGVWSDEECGFKGRSFDMVVDSFERYKFAAHKPGITLVRVTPFPRFTFFMSAEEKNSLKWKVPYAPPSGYAKAIVLPVQTKDQEEIHRRVRKAYEQWRKQ